jgi:AcrR family transcriptional regulator
MSADSVKRRRADLPTRALILNEVQRLITLKGVYGFTLRDVAEPLGVQVPAIYKHYADRDDTLVELSRRFIYALAEQFQVSQEALRAPATALRSALDEFVDFHLANPAYVRLSLVDFATPGGGMEYIKLATGGPFRESIRRGPLAPMHRRVRRLIQAGVHSGDFRRVAPLDFYRLVKASLLFQLVFPDDALLTGTPSRAKVNRLKAELRDVAFRHLRPEPSTRRARGRRTR